MDALAYDVGRGDAAEEKARLDALDPDAADDYLDALLALGWKVKLGARDYALIPPAPGGSGNGGTRGFV